MFTQTTPVIRCVDARTLLRLHNCTQRLVHTAICPLRRHPAPPPAPVSIKPPKNLSLPATAPPPNKHTAAGSGASAGATTRGAGATTPPSHAFGRILPTLCGLRGAAKSTSGQCAHSQRCSVAEGQHQGRADGPPRLSLYPASFCRLHSVPPCLQALGLQPAPHRQPPRAPPPIPTLARPSVSSRSRECPRLHCPPASAPHSMPPCWYQSSCLPPSARHLVCPPASPGSLPAGFLRLAARGMALSALPVAAGQLQSQAVNIEETGTPGRMFTVVT